MPRLRHLYCPRCLRPVDPWPLKRPEVCSPPSWVWCIRQIGAVCTNWRALRPEVRRKIARARQRMIQARRLTERGRAPGRGKETLTE